MRVLAPLLSTNHEAARISVSTEERSVIRDHTSLPPFARQIAVLDAGAVAMVIVIVGIFVIVVTVVVHTVGTMRVRVDVGYHSVSEYRAMEPCCHLQQ